MEAIIAKLVELALNIAPVTIIVCLVVYYGHWLTIRAYKIFKKKDK